ncbi:MAG: histidine kinase [Lachnospiraceae bacterium]|nr:histidine kinase [Lachnospiraceae bacterium]
MTTKSAWNYIKKYKFNSLMLRNFAGAILIVALPLLLLVFIGYRKFSEEMNHRMADMNEELLQKSAVVTDNVMRDIMEVLEQLSGEEVVLSVMQTEEFGKREYAEVEEVAALICQYRQLNRYITSIYIYSDVNQRVIDGTTFSNIQKYGKKDIWYPVYKKIEMDSQYTLVSGENNILVCQPIAVNGGTIGIIVFDINLQKVKELLESEDLMQTGSFFVVDSAGQVLYCNQPEYFTASEREKHRYRKAIGQVKPGSSGLYGMDDSAFVSVVKSEHQSWKYALITERPTYKEEVGALKDFLVLMLVTGTVSGILAAYVITRVTYGPVKKIVEVIEEPRVHMTGETSRQSNELLYITSNILSTLRSKQKVDEELEERVESMRALQSMALQFQMEPHFLYNTLDLIKWSAVEDMGMGNRTSKLIAKLALLYRSGLEGGVRA